MQHSSETEDEIGSFLRIHWRALSKTRFTSGDRILIQTPLSSKLERLQVRPTRIHKASMRPSSGAGCNIGFHHLFWIDDAIKFSLRNKAQLQGGSLEREVIIHSVVSDL